MEGGEVPRRRFHAEPPGAGADAYRQRERSPTRRGWEGDNGYGQGTPGSWAQQPQPPRERSPGSPGAYTRAPSFERGRTPWQAQATPGTGGFARTPRAPGGYGTPAGQTFKPGDWICKNCNGHNFERRHRCYTCGQMRDYGGEGMDQGAPGAGGIHRVGSGLREAAVEGQRGWKGEAAGGGGYSREAFPGSSAAGYGDAKPPPPPPEAPPRPPEPPAPAAEQLAEENAPLWHYMDQEDPEMPAFGPFPKAWLRKWLSSLLDGPEKNDKEFRRFAQMLVWCETDDPSTPKRYLMDALGVPNEVQTAILIGKPIPKVANPCGSPSAPLPPTPGLNAQAQATSVVGPGVTGPLLDSLRDYTAEVVRDVLHDSKEWRDGKLGRDQFKEVATRVTEQIVNEHHQSLELQQLGSVEAYVTASRREGMVAMARGALEQL